MVSNGEEKLEKTTRRGIVRAAFTLPSIKMEIENNAFETIRCCYELINMIISRSLARFATCFFLEQTFIQLFISSKSPLKNITSSAFQFVSFFPRHTTNNTTPNRLESDLRFVIDGGSSDDLDEGVEIVVQQSLLLVEIRILS
jgi:hypothetical protein